jgi:8-oxo-dGTP pyrophosphatase MutT (NUDIX family)
MAVQLDWLPELKEKLARPQGVDEHYRSFIKGKVQPHIAMLAREFSLPDDRANHFLGQLLLKDPAIVKLVKGEAVDVVGPGDEYVTMTERGFAHTLGLRHRTANSFVVSTDGGSVWLQRRAHNKSFGLCLSIFGGHVKAGACYEDTIREELPEELGLTRRPLEGNLVEVGNDRWERADDPNVEIRKLYAYKLTSQEEEIVEQAAEELSKAKEVMTREGYKSWLHEKQKTLGEGEVWGYYRIGVCELKGVPRDQPLDEPLRGYGELPYKEVSDVFIDDSQTTERAYFTPDLLAPIISEACLLDRVVSVIRQLARG